MEVKRCFSIYKTLLSDNYRSFWFENIKNNLVVQCESLKVTKQKELKDFY